MKHLTNEEILKLASKKGVKRIAVINFLSTLDLKIGAYGNTMNAGMDAAMYKWNSATVNAIMTGIRMAERKG
jgi:hypothetical protein